MYFETGQIRVVKLKILVYDAYVKCFSVKGGRKVQGAIVRGIRGAIDVSANDAEEIVESTKELLDDMTAKNEVGQ